MFNPPRPADTSPHETAPGVDPSSGSDAAPDAGENSLPAPRETFVTTNEAIIASNETVASGETASPSSWSEVASGETPAFAEDARRGSGTGAAPENLRVLFDAAPIAVALTRDGVVLYANPSLVALLGARDEGEIMGKSARDFLSPDEQSIIIERSQARTRDGFRSQPTRYEASIRRLDGTLVPMRVEVAPIMLADGPALVSYAFDLSLERRDRQEIETLLAKERRTARLASQLQELSAALSLTTSPDDVAGISLESCMAAAGAFGAVFVVPARHSQAASGQTSEQTLLLLQSRGYPAEVVAGWTKMQADDATPLACAFRTGEAVWVGDSDDPEFVARFPVLRGAKQSSGSHALVALPLRLDERVLGVMGLSFDQTRIQDEEERTFLLTLASQCAQALQRTHLDLEARDLARRQRESLALLNTLLDSAPVGFGLFDRDHQFVLVNEELARISGRPLAFHIGENAATVFPHLAGHVDELLEQVWNEGQPSGEISFSPDPDGSAGDERHCSLALYPVRVSSVEGGEILGVGAIFIETTQREKSDLERERLFAQLEVERARFEAILQQMPSAVVIAEAPSGRLVLGNEQVESVLGHPFWRSQSIAGYSAYRGFHPDGRDVQTHEWPLARALQSGEIVRGEELLMPRDDGTMGVVRINAAPIRDRDDTIVAGIAIFDNVTERARTDGAQRFLAEAGAILVAALDERQEFQSLANLCVPRIADWCIIALAEPDGSLHNSSIAHADPAQSELARRLGELLERDPRLPWNVVDALGTRQAALYSPGVFASLRSDEADGGYRLLLREIGVQSAIIAPLSARGRTLGAMFWLNAGSKRPFDETDVALAEEVAHRAALSADNARLLQEAQVARDAAQKARDEAQAANRAKDEFLAVVSHELRTPLTPILGWLELLRSPAADDALRKQAYDVIERNANAQAQLVNDILDVSRITTGKLRLELRDVALDELVARSVESLRTVWNEKRLNVKLDLQSGLHADADAGRLGQVVWNLLQNAIKFTPSSGEIHVSLYRISEESSSSSASKIANASSAANDLGAANASSATNGLGAINGSSATGGSSATNASVAVPRARLEVRDSGAGISADLLPRIFDRFQQGDSSSTRKAGGLGLGLAIVKHIAELHGGSVDVRSAGRGLGATFGVELPLTADQPSVLSPPQTEFPPERIGGEKLKGFRILVVDDEPFTREMLARLLEDAGAQVRVAAGGRAALDIVPQFAPQAIVCDIGMPDMDGFELRRELLLRGQTMPAVALTAYASASDEARAREAGFERYLAKPIGALDLVEVVAQLLQRAK